MEWESKFSSIVRDTESNLAKVKHRLALGSSVHTNGTHGSALYPTTQSMMNPTRWEIDISNSGLPHGDRQGAGYNAEQVDYLSMSDGHLPLERSPGAMAVLQEKIEIQASAIENISKTLQQLQSERDQYHQQVVGLREEMSLLNSRLAERGVDIQTERKVEKMKQDMMSEMQLMKTQFELSRAREDNASFYSSSNSGGSLSRELYQLKQFMKGHFESFHQDINSLRIRLGTVESTLGDVNNESRNIQDVQQSFRKNIQGLAKSHLSTAQDLSLKIGEQRRENFEVHELKNSIKSLGSSLEKLESRLRDSKGSRSGAYRTQKRSLKSRPQKHVIDLMSPDPETSDLDLSSTDYDLGDLKSTDDLTELKSSDLSLSPVAPGNVGKHGDSNLLGNLSNLDLGDVSTADDLSDGEPLSVDDL